MSRPWMPLYIADFVADTMHLSAGQTGGYLLLLGHYWQHGSLPLDDQALARIARMSGKEWSKAKPAIKAFFSDDWKQKRLAAELAKAASISSKRSASAKQKHSNSSANAEQLDTHARASPQPQLQKEDTELRSDAGASDDPRTRLFREGLSKLAALTGKGPDACRSFVGKCLKSADDSAIVVLGLIEDAERNRVADPAGWIAGCLKAKGNSNGKPTVHDAAKELTRHIEELNERPSGLRQQAGPGAIRLLPSG